VLRLSLPGGLPQAEVKARKLVRLPADNWIGMAFCFAQLGPYKFAPLITRLGGLACSLAIRFLRYGEPGSVITDTGDLDNRLKVLLDALRMPLAPEELPASTAPMTDDEYFFVLLEDDSLITGFSVDGRRLLIQQPDKFYAEVAIDVSVRSLGAPF
jgi:hypothetical protein